RRLSGCHRPGDDGAARSPVGHLPPPVHQQRTEQDRGEYPGGGHPAGVEEAGSRLRLGGVVRGSGHSGRVRRGRGAGDLPWFPGRRSRARAGGRGRRRRAGGRGRRGRRWRRSGRCRRRGRRRRRGWRGFLRRLRVGRTVGRLVGRTVSPVRVRVLLRLAARFTTARLAAVWATAVRAGVRRVPVRLCGGLRIAGDRVTGRVPALAPVVRVGGQNQPVTGLDVVGVVGVPLRVRRVERGDLRIAQLIPEVTPGDVPHPV